MPNNTMLFDQLIQRTRNDYDDPGTDYRERVPQEPRPARRHVRRHATQFWQDAKPRARKVKWDDQPRPPLRGEIPRYVFNLNIGPGCGQPKHPPSCLCDVIVSQETPIEQAPLLFGSIATAENGHPSKRNLVAWASTLLGCFEMERRLVEREDTNGVYYRLPYQSTQPTGWELLTPEIREDLVWWGTQQAKFSQVKTLVPTAFTSEQRKHVRKMFNHYKTNNNRKQEKPQ